jgi:hypothetical protein
MGKVDPEVWHGPPLTWPRVEALLSLDRTALDELSHSAVNLYSPFDRRNLPDGKKWRHIDCPTRRLKHLQRKIQRRILRHVHLPATMFGSVRGRTIVDNAARHEGSRELVTLDLKNCFPNTSNEQVYEVWRDVFGCSAKVSATFTRLTTLARGVPQGAPTSSTLVNLCLLKMHDQLSELADEQGLSFSIYVDDIGFSGTSADRILAPAIEIIEKNGYAVSNRKTRVMRAGSQKILTGVGLNRGLSAGGSRIRRIRNAILQLAVREEIPNYLLVSLRGQVEQIRSIKPSQGNSLSAFLERHLPEIGAGGDGPKSYETRACPGRGHPHEFEPASLS